MSRSELSMQERIQLALDGRLDVDERRALERELASSDEGRRQLDSMKWLKRRVGAAFEGSSESPMLRERILRALDEADAAEQGGERATAADPASRRAALAWGLAAAAVLVLAVALVGTVVSRRAPGGDLASSVAQDYRTYRAGELKLQMLTSDGETLEAFFAGRGIPFPTRVFDLGMMNFTLLGGVAHELRGGASAAFVYEGAEGVRLLCQMYRGKIEDLPPGADVREHNCIKFYSYRVGETSMTFWREGDVICVLAAEVDPEDVLRVAIAKAVMIRDRSH